MDPTRKLGRAWVSRLHEAICKGCFVGLGTQKMARHQLIIVPTSLAVGCREDGHPGALTKQAYALTWWQAVGVLLDRQWKLTIRDSALVRGRIIQARACLVTMAFVINLMSVPSCLQ